MSAEHRSIMSSLSSNVGGVSFESFIGSCEETLDKSAPLKIKYVSSKHNLFLNKEILKAIVNQAGLTKI